MSFGNGEKRIILNMFWYGMVYDIKNVPVYTGNISITLY